MAGVTSRAVARALVRRLDRSLVILGGTVSVAAIVLIGGTLLVSVALRYSVGRSLEFATELPSYAFPWLVCGGIVAAAGTAGHMAVDFIVVRLPARVRQVVEVVAWASIALAFVWSVMAALRLLASYEGIGTPILGWPAVGSYWAFPLALIALAVHAIGRLVATLLGVDTHIDTVESAAAGVREVGV